MSKPLELHATAVGSKLASREGTTEPRHWPFELDLSEYFGLGARIPQLALSRCLLATKLDIRPSVRRGQLCSVMLW